MITGNTNEMARVGADGKLGYGGACFPKDVNAWHKIVPHYLTEFMNEYNHFLRGE
jgi:UDP-glucose 6-dehydrogenase